jgi:NAD(P)-dependent dehydrogenase (short-subunit alcohol dehydrogenase family)
MGRVAGKRAAVIGAGSVGAGWGNGKAAAVLYAREGAEVLCVDRNAEAAEATAALIREEGGQARVFAGDMTDPQAAQAMAGAAREMGGLDILHFNIGISTRGGLEETGFADWQRVFAVNLDAAFHVTQATLPLLEEGGGAIVYISSLAGEQNGPYRYVGYEASKAALQRLSKSVAIEYAARGVRANCVLPGMIDTPHAASFIGPDVEPAALARARAAKVPMQRQGTAWDVAEAALFLASDAAGFVTGVELRVDGGMGTAFASAG